MSITPYNNIYYNNKYSKYYAGVNPAITGNYPKGADSDFRTGYAHMNVLPNCVGFAIGRFNELIGNGNCYYSFGAGNASTFYGKAGNYKLQTGTVPAVGALICWDNGGAGHVAVVESVTDNTDITISESGWNYSSSFAENIRVVKGDGNWTYRPDDNKGGWMYTSSYTYRFQGFIYNPYNVPDNTSDIYYYNTSPSSTKYTGGAYTEKEVETTYRAIETAQYSGTLSNTKSNSLLSYPSLVEAPFVIVDFNGIKFGTYSKYTIDNIVHIDYPNYINSLDVVKINGSLNQYTINMTYQIRANDDPNLVDKILSSVGYGTIKISYGDWQSPTFIYKEEEALITKVTSSVDFTNSRITYSISCTSNSVGLYATSTDFPAKHAKPSNVIKEVFNNSKYGLQEVFYGMTKYNIDNLISSDDKVVDIDARPSTDPLTYINFLVTCMIAETNADNSVILDSSYFLTIHDDTYGTDYGGPYFTVNKVTADSGTIKSYDTYEIDVGYPSENMVMDFNITSDNSWSLIYNYNDSVYAQDYTYRINNQGQIETNYSPDITTSANKFITTPVQKTWWTQMTQFPITATLTIKGLVRPAMLMTYIKVNALFFGQRHISSGMYFVTRQEDKIDSRGYRTILTLQRFAGDDDYVASTLTTTKTTVQVWEPAETPTGYVQTPTDLSTGSTSSGFSNTTSTKSTSAKPKKKTNYTNGAGATR